MGYEKDRLLNRYGFISPEIMRKEKEQRKVISKVIGDIDPAELQEIAEEENWDGR